MLGIMRHGCNKIKDAIEKIKDIIDDISYNIPDWVIFTIKVSVICVAWIFLIT
tara:strand:- start:2566 stop:2724 length:159 start_codon:yes stop_codon:yes gene_type:complete